MSLDCTSYELVPPDSFVYAGSVNRPGEGVRYVGMIGYDVTNDCLEMYVGGGTWATVAKPVSGPIPGYTPTMWTNGTATLLGTGPGQLGWHTRLGRKITAWGLIVLGTGPTVSAGANLEVSLPVAALATPAVQTVGTGTLFDGTTPYAVTAVIDSSQPSRIRFARNGSYASSSSPFTIAAGDRVSWCAEYIAAS